MAQDTSDQPADDAAHKRERLQALLAQRAAAATDSAARSSIVPVREQGSDPPLFCVLAGGADLPAYKRLAVEFSGPKIFALQLAGATAEDPVIRSIESMARLFRQALGEFPYEGPYILCGHSVGATIAFELAHQLQQVGEQVALVVLIDQPGPDVRLTKRDWLYWQWAAISRLPWRRRWEYIIHGLRYRIATNDRLPSLLRRAVQRRKKSPAEADGDRVSVADYRRKMTDAVLDAIKTYHPQPYRNAVALLRAESGSPSIHCDPQGGWGKVAVGGLQVLEIPGHHMSIFQAPHISVLAGKLTTLYEGARVGLITAHA